MLALTLALLLGVEWLVLGLAAMVQARQASCCFIRPLSRHRYDVLALLAANLLVGFLAAFAGYTAGTPRLAQLLWSYRALPIALETLLALHGAFALQAACSALLPAVELPSTERRCLGIFAPVTQFWSKVLVVLAIALFGCAVVLPSTILVDGREGSQLVQAGAAAYESIATALLFLALIGLPRLLGLYSSLAGKRRRWASMVLTTLLLLGAAMAFTRAVIAPGSLVVAASSTVYTIASASLLIHWAPLAACADVWLTGQPIFGFEPTDAPTGARKRRGGAMLLLFLAFACAAVGGVGLLLASGGLIEFGEAGEAGGSSLPLASWNSAAKCNLIFGIDVQPHSRMALGDETLEFALKNDVHVVARAAGFRPERPSAQRELELFCEHELTNPATSPLHPGYRMRGLEPDCLVLNLRDWLIARREGANASDPSVVNVTAPTPIPSLFRIKGLQQQDHGEFLAAPGLPWNDSSWPLPEHLFVPALRDYLAENPSDMSEVGFLNMSHVAWLKISSLRARHSRGTGANGQALAQPAAMAEWIRTWTSWIASLPSQVRQIAADDVPLPAEQESVLAHGWSTCPPWQTYPTLRAFLDGVTKALVYTPIFCMAALLLALWDLPICFAALYSVVAMIVVTLGTLNLAGVPLGPIESLALAVIIGVSIDYIIHLAFAYSHSMLEDRYYKSRAAVLARAGSISSSAVTTLCAVLPLLGAKLLPMRQFGGIFTIVVAVAFIFTMLFFTPALMIVGSLGSSKSLTSATRTMGAAASSPTRV